MKIKFKKTVTITLILACLCIGFSACSDNDDENLEEQLDAQEEEVEASDEETAMPPEEETESPIDLSANFSAIINGEVYAPDYIVAEKDADSDIFNLIASLSDTHQVRFYFTDLEPGSYEFKPDDSNNSATVVNTSLFAGAALSVWIPNANGELPGGIFTILTHDKDVKKITGTFEFTAFPIVDPEFKIEVTEGTFDVTYKLIRDGFVVEE